MIDNLVSTNLEMAIFLTDFIMRKFNELEIDPATGLTISTVIMENALVMFTPEEEEKEIREEIRNDIKILVSKYGVKNPYFVKE